MDAIRAVPGHPVKAGRVERLVAEYLRRAVFVQVADERGVFCDVDGIVRIDSVPARGVVDLHTT